MSDVRGAHVGAGLSHGRSLSQERSLQTGDRNRAKSRTRVHGLADIDPKFISQVRWREGESRGFSASFCSGHYSFLMIFLTLLLTKLGKDSLYFHQSEHKCCLYIQRRFLQKNLPFKHQILASNLSEEFENYVLASIIKFDIEFCCYLNTTAWTDDEIQVQRC